MSEIISNFRSQTLPTYKFPTSYLTDPQRFRWQPTSDIHIKLDNINQPIIAFPLIKNTTYMILDGNHRATKALKESKPFLNGIFINREEFFKNLIFFPSNFDFYASFLSTVLNELSYLELLNRQVNTIPQSFFPPKLPDSSHLENKRRGEVFRLYD
ncbi:ParB/Srx family N-terminal domain-containing protein [Lactococcus garvieae]|uniref:ParB/Srx family N-terminal domain-containing protein n=1 Tax=Lactococcus garvieae TaxID=1363 RepID=UPI00254EE431|nr:ParB/Srx family N-terminal domain-containing protein [Lactococcus garvieae]